MLVIPAQVARHRGQQELNQGIGHTLSAVVTLFLALSLALLVQHLPADVACYYAQRRFSQTGKTVARRIWESCQQGMQKARAK